VSANYKEEQTRFFFNRPFSLKLDQQLSHVIAVRYSFNKKNLYLKFTNARPCMRLVLKANNQAFADYIEREGFYSTLRSIQVSFYLPLGFLLLFLYFSHRLKKEYLYVGIFCFCMFMGMLMHILGLLESNSVSGLNAYLLATQVLYISGAFTFLNGIYTLYKQKKSWFYYVMGFYGLLIIPFFFIFPDWSGIYNACFFPLINFEFLRLNLQALRRRPGAWILFITSILLVLGLICFIWLSVIGEQASSALVSSICFVLPGIGLSLFFAGEFAHTRSALHLRVLEVEQLSQKTVAQEKEKQQILAVQNETLDKQVTERTAELSKSLKDLKETQTQLIQREKMASLGELTAGIAHEIQNPLNFVNNFSEVSVELLNELKEDLHQKLPEASKAEADAMVEDLSLNLEKINHHGKRADAIVKGMLQHSRSSSGVKELTDINVLADEYLRLCYHGLRAKDKAFNAGILLCQRRPSTGKKNKLC
jgi:signal transduction histidine kinase